MSASAADPETGTLTFGRFVETYGDRVDPLLVLTDEELYVVTAGVPADQRLVPLEVVDALDPAEREARARAALRSLTARGLCASVPEGARDDEAGLAELEVRGVLAMALHGLTHEGVTVLASSTEGPHQRRRVIVTLEEAGVIEHGFGDGVHEVSVFSPRRACVELAGLLDPAGLAGSEDRELDRAAVDDTARQPGWVPSEPATSAHLRRAKPGEPDLELLFAAHAEHGLVMVSGESESQDGSLSHLRARSISQGTLLGLCAQVLDLARVVRGR